MIANAASLNNKSIQEIKESYEKYKAGKEYQQSDSNSIDDDSESSEESLFDELLEIDNYIAEYEHYENHVQLELQTIPAAEETDEDTEAAFFENMNWKTKRY